MKSFTFYMMFIVLLTTGYTIAGKKDFTLKVNIKGFEKGKAIIFFQYVETKIVAKDTAEISGGSFLFKGKIDSPVLADILIMPSKIVITIFIGPGNIEAFYDEAKKKSENDFAVDVKGSTIHLEYEKVFSFNRVKIDSVYALYKAEKDEKKKESLHTEMEKYQDESRKYEMEFVETHLNSPVSAYIMMFNTNDYNVDFKKLNKIFMGFGPLVKSSYYYKKIKAEFNGIKLIQPGKQAPDFTLNTPDNKPLTLSSLKGKYLLLDFWASWCQPCRQSFPQMKDIYKKYHDKGVEFLGISDDSKLDAWKKALADDQLPWLQVVDEFPEKYKPARVGTLYSVHYIPSTILLDKTGKIIAKNLHGDELEKMLNELLNK